MQEKLRTLHINQRTACPTEALVSSINPATYTSVKKRSITKE